MAGATITERSHDVLPAERVLDVRHKDQRKKETPEIHEPIIDPESDRTGRASVSPKMVAGNDGFKAPAPMAMTIKLAKTTKYSVADWSKNTRRSTKSNQGLSIAESLAGPGHDQQEYPSA